MIEQIVDIPASAGTIPTFIVHPEREGPFPLVVFLMDALGVREELRDMARRLASVGYYAMLPDLSHRRGGEPAALAADAERARAFEMSSSLSLPMVLEDADALLDFADRDPAASPGRAGCIGYGMSGQYAVSLAARHPERIGAAASICGAKLATDRDDSPHLALQRASAEFYFACAEHDSWAPVEMVEMLEQAAKTYGPTTEVEIFPAAHYGFVFPERADYDKAAAERHWERLFSLFRRRLQRGITAD